MTYVPPLDTSAARPRIPRELDPVEVRVLGALMEKQMATPEYYPLTVNALVAACNQKSNREPVMELSESDVQRALDRLQDEKLVWKVMGGRAVRYDHNLDHVWHLNRREKALITLLFLRGPQTAGELRGRSDRLHTFESVPEVEEILRDMAAHSEPLVRQLPRRPGQKEERWAHLVSGAPVEEVARGGGPARGGGGGPPPPPRGAAPPAATFRRAALRARRAPGGTGRRADGGAAGAEGEAGGVGALAYATCSSPRCGAARLPGQRKAAAA